MNVKAILFDLDGTLQDTAIDLAAAANKTRAELGLSELDYVQFRHSVHGGANTMVHNAFGIHESHPKFSSIKSRMLEHYCDTVGQQTPLFEGIPQLLDYIEFKNIPWGVVTTKSMRFAKPALEAYHLDKRASCLVAGDSVARVKPFPDPLIHACDLMGVDPATAVYVGDNEVDALASRAANMRNIIVSYGYFDRSTHPLHWGADVVVHHPQQIIEWLKSQR